MTSRRLLDFISFSVQRFSCFFFRIYLLAIAAVAATDFPQTVCNKLWHVREKSRRRRTVKTNKAAQLWRARGARLVFRFALLLLRLLCLLPAIFSFTQAYTWFRLHVLSVPPGDFVVHLLAACFLSALLLVCRLLQITSALPIFASEGCKQY